MKILITPRSFAKANPALLERMKSMGLELVLNTTGATLGASEMKTLIEPCAGVILGVDPLDKEVLACAPHLKVVSRYGVGLDNVALSECEKRGISVYRTLGAIENTVADYAMALILAVSRRICLMDRHCRQNDWAKIQGIDLFGKTVGIIGLGAVGKCVARRCRAFEARILANDIVWDGEFAMSCQITRASVDEICGQADIVTLHCSLTPETRHVINAARLGVMKREAILINTARGGLVDDEALLSALSEKRIYGAGLDVFEREPPVNPLWRTLDNVVLGSHCASSTREAGKRMGELAVANLLAGLKIGS